MRRCVTEDYAPGKSFLLRSIRNLFPRKVSLPHEACSGTKILSRCEAMAEPAIAERSFDEDAALIERIRAGEDDLFMDLIQPYERSVYHVAFSVLKNTQDAEDASQETFLKAFRHLDQLRALRTFRRWLLQIARNEALLRRRKDRLHLHDSIDEPDDAGDSDFTPHDLADWREVPSKILERKEVCWHLNRALEGLPQKYRETFVLRDVQHLSEKEASEVLGVSVAAVKVRLHRARLLLREKLTPVFGRRRWIHQLDFFKKRQQTVSCELVLQQLSNYIDNSLDRELMVDIEKHARSCRRCSVLVDSTRKVVQIYCDERVLEMPDRYSERLRAFIMRMTGKR